MGRAYFGTVRRSGEQREVFVSGFLWGYNPVLDDRSVTGVTLHGVASTEIRVLAYPQMCCGNEAGS